MKEKYIGMLAGIIPAAMAMGFAFLLPEQIVLDFFTILLGIALIQRMQGLRCI